MTVFRSRRHKGDSQEVQIGTLHMLFSFGNLVAIEREGEGSIFVNAQLKRMSKNTVRHISLWRPGVPQDMLQAEAFNEHATALLTNALQQENANV